MGDASVNVKIVLENISQTHTSEEERAATSKGKFAGIFISNTDPDITKQLPLETLFLALC